jgi:ribosome-binding ATPase YchF (GTP1/OBG family)
MSTIPAVSHARSPRLCLIGNAQSILQPTLAQPTTLPSNDIHNAAFLDQCSADAKAAGLSGPNAVVRSMVPRLIRAGRQALCLQSFYTAGPKEVRAWTIMQGTLAPQAAGVIHTDFERGFIKAEVAAFEDFKALHSGQASMAKVKEAGKYRQEGKQYVMQDGDIVVFMHNTTTAAKKK